MTSAVYLEHYLDSLENLPIELQRNFTLMRDLDSRAQEVMKIIDKKADDFMNNIKSMTSERKKEIISEIQTHFNKAKEYGDDKVQLAIQTYELVDKHIRRLDSDLQRFDSEIHEKLNRTIEEQASNKRGRKKVKESEKKKRVPSSDDESGDKGPKKKKKAGGKTGGKGAAPGPTEQEILDMPVDPNEPTYCLCHQVSYGEMIGCDNLDCPIEWFHFACVGLTIKPKGKWFCPKCSQDRKKK